MNFTSLGLSGLLQSKDVRTHYFVACKARDGDTNRAFDPTFSQLHISSTGVTAKCLELIDKTKAIKPRQVVYRHPRFPADPNWQQKIWLSSE
ncbi:hypothetical protein H4CHR_05069 [Variovorax sp. PBS-H4]|nr:hypothetical protein H4CHR_05069 [Variovorax sp. PBS-H4]